MLSVQLSIIKLVFRHPCVVKARFCPLDNSLILKKLKGERTQPEEAAVFVLLLLKGNIILLVPRWQICLFFARPTVVSLYKSAPPPLPPPVGYLQHSKEKVTNS